MTSRYRPEAGNTGIYGMTKVQRIFIHHVTIREILAAPTLSLKVCDIRAEAVSLGLGGRVPRLLGFVRPLTHYLSGILPSGLVQYFRLMLIQQHGYKGVSGLMRSQSSHCHSVGPCSKSAVLHYCNWMKRNQISTCNEAKLAEGSRLLQRSSYWSRPYWDGAMEPYVLSLIAAAHAISFTDKWRDRGDFHFHISKQAVPSEDITRLWTGTWKVKMASGRFNCSIALDPTVTFWYTIFPHGHRRV